MKYPAITHVVMGLSLMACDNNDNAMCEKAPPDTLVSVIDHNTWRLAAFDEDPWKAHRPENIECAAEGRVAEDFAGIYSFGVDTGLCPFTTVVQPLTTDICDGEQLYVWLWRFQLTGPEGSTSTLAVVIGDEPVWEAIVPIPATSALVALQVPLPHGYAKGTPIHFHVRNHGNNNYQLLDLGRCNGNCSPD